MAGADDRPIVAASEWRSLYETARALLDEAQLLIEEVRAAYQPAYIPPGYEGSE